MAGRDTSIVDGPAPSSSSNEEDETSSSEGTTSTQVAATQPPQTDPGAVEVKAFLYGASRATADSALPGNPG